MKVMMDAFSEGNIDRLFLAHNGFVTTMTQQPCVDQLLPVSAPESDERLEQHWDYLYEPDAHDVVDALMMRYVESLHLPRRGGKYFLRDGRPNGGHEVRIGQCGYSD